MDQVRCLKRHLGHILARGTIGQELLVFLSKITSTINALRVETLF